MPDRYTFHDCDTHGVVVNTQTGEATRYDLVRDAEAAARMWNASNRRPAMASEIDTSAEVMEDLAANLNAFGFYREAERISAVVRERDAANASRVAAEGERDRARDALEPFACVADTEIGGDEDDNDWFTTTALKLKVRHFRNALAALTPAPEAPNDGE